MEPFIQIDGNRYATQFAYRDAALVCAIESHGFSLVELSFLRVSHLYSAKQVFVREITLSVNETDHLTQRRFKIKSENFKELLEGVARIVILNAGDNITTGSDFLFRNHSGNRYEVRADFFSPLTYRPVGLEAHISQLKERGIYDAILAAKGVFSNITQPISIKEANKSNMAYSYH